MITVLRNASSFLDMWSIAARLAQQLVGRLCKNEKLKENSQAIEKKQ